MSREEEKIKAANNYCIDARLGYPRVMDDTDKLILKAYLEGVNWADQHPREGLWDANKVIKWLQDNADSYTWYDEFESESGMTDDFIKDLQKAMEEE